MYLWRWEVYTVDNHGNKIDAGEVPRRFIRQKTALQYIRRMHRIRNRFSSYKNSRLYDRKTKHWTAVWIINDPNIRS